MNRIFKSLGIFSLVFLVATFLLGLSLEMGDIRDPADLATRTRASLHRLAGIAAGMLVILVDSVAVTYFVGTSRWVREVCETYRIDQQHVEKSAALKRAAFPWAVTNMVLAVAIVGLGGAADPAASTRLPIVAGIEWKWWHLTAASAGLFVILYGFVHELQHMLDNQQVIGRVMNEVRRIRQERGLDTH
jgi:hypothetical protein